MFRLWRTLNANAVTVARATATLRRDQIRVSDGSGICASCRIARVTSFALTGNYPKTEEYKMPAEELKPRDWRIIALVAEAYTNKQIAKAIGTTEGVVKNHMKEIMDETGMDNRTGVALWFLARQRAGVL
jgi:two-component system nitrate/nitrite response regulator NarL